MSLSLIARLGSSWPIPSPSLAGPMSANRPSSTASQASGSRLSTTCRGSTRDRKETSIRIGKHEVILTDTAGLEDAEPGSIAARMREQSEQAIAEFGPCHLRDRRPRRLTARRQGHRNPGPQLGKALHFGRQQVRRALLGRRLLRRLRLGSASRSRSPRNTISALTISCPRS